MLNLSAKWRQLNMTFHWYLARAWKGKTKQNKNQNIDINIKRCTKWKEKKKKTYSTYQCSWNVCQICSNLKPLAFEGQGVCELQFFVFHVDIRVDVTWQNLLFMAPFSLNASVFRPLWILESLFTFVYNFINVTLQTFLWTCMLQDRP